LRKGKIREVQVTLDGTAPVHNSRRFLKGGGGTFNKIVKGIDACLKDNIDVNLRMVIDKENIDNLSDLLNLQLTKAGQKAVILKPRSAGIMNCIIASHLRISFLTEYPFTKVYLR